VDWIYLAQDMDRWQTLVNTMTNLRARVRFEVLTAMKMAVFFFWVVTPCGFVGRYRFGGTY
jgi:hypothetical protein